MIQAFIWTTISSWFLQFWGWIAGGVLALAAFLFSPHIRKYTFIVLGIAVYSLALFIGGYLSNHSVQTITHTCNEFRSHLVSGPATDKAILIFKRNGLCV